MTPEDCRLAIVAEMMDQFLRAEYEALNSEYSTLTLRYREIRTQFEMARVQLHQTRVQLRQSEMTLQDTLDLNENLQERTHYLEDFITRLRDFPQPQRTRRRLPFEQIDLTTTSSDEEWTIVWTTTLYYKK